MVAVSTGSPTDTSVQECPSSEDLKMPCALVPASMIGPLIITAVTMMVSAIPEADRVQRVP
jgi:hypothetical protein